jgi:mannose-6-phosphate isomerase
MKPSVLVLDNPIQHYAWGSRTAIAELLGRPTPSERPDAELWIGAHPLAPSRIAVPEGLGTLDRAIENDPVGLLGADVCDRFGNELPFLLKVLAAAEPLSIQAHPNQEQARAGWARENAEGIPLDAPRRNYRDPNHKPELLSALTRFVALKGFRLPEDAARALEPVARPELQQQVQRLARERSPAALRALVARLMTLEAEERTPLLQRAAAEAARRSREPAWHWVKRLGEQYPGDVGALAPLYLHLLTLAPGQAIFLGPGELHAYLEGTALEVMASSDNVLRGGLTRKHVDVQELLATLVFEPQAAALLEPEALAPGERLYATPAREFELALVDVAPGRSQRGAGGRLELLLQIEGSSRIAADGRETPLDRGASVLLPAALGGYELAGEGRLARVRVPA